MHSVLTTLRLVLRQVEPSDAGFLCELMNEPAYLAHIGDRGVRNLADATQYIADKYTASYAERGYGLYLVEAKSSREPVGVCGLIKREVLADPDIGFAVLKRHRRHGYAYEAAHALLGYARNVLGASRINGVTSPANVASIRLLEKLGLRYERMILLEGNDGESRLYVLTWDEPTT
jgi:RimJ/RimL family protein N-acetyltransferase